MSPVIGYATNRRKKGNEFLDNEPDSIISYSENDLQTLINKCRANSLKTVIYIRGFNYDFNSFEARLQQVHRRMGNDFNLIGLDWASFGDTGWNFFKYGDCYLNDRKLAQNILNISFLSKVLKEILERFSNPFLNNSKLFLMSHSMGTYVLGNALKHWNPVNLPRQFNATFLLASDTDSSALNTNGNLNFLFQISKNVYNYYAETDLPLQASRNFIGNTPRLGLIGAVMKRQNLFNTKIIFKNLNVGSTGTLEHHYYDYTYPFVMQDITKVMNGDGQYQAGYGNYELKER